MLTIYLQALQGYYSEVFMFLLYKVALYSHITCGTMALFLFWYPLFVKKGSPNHNRFGGYYAKLMYLVGWSGVVCCTLVLLDPLAIRQVSDLSGEQLERFIQRNRGLAVFLLMLSVLTISSIYHGLAVLKAKEKRQQLKNTTHLGLLGALLACSIVILALGLQVGNTLLIVFALLGSILALASLRYIFKKTIKQRQWIIEHLGSMLGSGIGVYTAFSAVGGRHVLLELLGNDGIILSWIAPGVIGSVGIAWASRKFSARYRVA